MATVLVLQQMTKGLLHIFSLIVQGATNRRWNGNSVDFTICSSGTTPEQGEPHSSPTMPGRYSSTLSACVIIVLRAPGLRSSTAIEDMCWWNRPWTFDLPALASAPFDAAIVAEVSSAETTV